MMSTGSNPPTVRISPAGLIARGKADVCTALWEYLELRQSCCVFPASQICFTNEIPLPFETGLACLLRPPYVQFCCCCAIPVVSARKLFHEQQN